MKFADLELERCVIGSMLIDNSVIVNVANYINTDNFSSETNRKIYKGILELNASGKPADIVAINFMRIADAGYVAQLTDAVPSGANWEYYAKKLKELALVRSYFSVLEKYKDVTEHTILESIGDVSRELLRLADQSGSSSKVKTLKEVMPAVCDRLSYAIKHKGELFGLDTGFKQLNTYLGGLQAGYVFIGARPSVGKTAFGMNIAINIAKQNIKGVIFQLEMSDEALAFRAISSEAGISMGLIKGGFINSGSPLTRVLSAIETVSELPLAIEDNISEIHEIEARIRYLVRCEKYQFVMIDHFSIIKTKNNRVLRHEQFTEISGIIRDLRRELKIPIIVLAQLRRDAEGKVPTLADIRETGSAEQDADTVIFIHRDRQEDMGQTEIPAELIIAKQRDGACGTIPMTFFPQMVKFADVPERNK